MNIVDQAKAALRELLDATPAQLGDIVVIGCSTSEVAGRRIGAAASPEIGKELATAFLPILRERELYLAAQCCEHLNRALAVEKGCAERHGLSVVCAVPYPEAGGAFAAEVFRELESPVLVERVEAVAGLDIGDTMIGMHIKRVAVPMRLSADRIGEARVLAACSRPPLIGGARARYE